MSHVATVSEIAITDLDMLDRACQRLGLELRRGQKTYHWFGESVGDHPLPAGFTVADLGKCDHAIGIPGDRDQPIQKRPYEVGVCRNPNGRPGYVLCLDQWLGGFGLVNRVGEDCGLLCQSYSAEVSKRTMQLKGFQVSERVVNGQLQVVCRKA